MAVSTSLQAMSTSLLQGVTVRRGPNAVRVRDRGRTRFQNQNRKVRASLVLGEDQIRPIGTGPSVCLQACLHSYGQVSTADSRFDQPERIYASCS